MAIQIRRIILGLAIVAALNAVLFAAEPKRARPPVWSRDVLDAFYDDARIKLEGPRPDYEHTPDSPESSPASAGGSEVTTVTPAFAWSHLIDADTLESEVKRTSQLLNRDVNTPSDFKAGGYKLARRDFSFLASLFAVTGQYDGQARWQDATPGLRDLFARAGYNAKVGTDQTYREAKQRKQDLSDLIRGSRPQLPQAERDADWAHVADRKPLMQRLNIAHEDRLTKWLSDAAAFKRNRDDIRHEAQLVAMIAEIISRSGYEFSDEEDYATYARDLKQSAIDLTTAATADNFTQARGAITRATKTCTNCHESYR